MGNSEFHFKKFSIINQNEGLKVTTDACVLGAIAKIKNPLHILDIGTGTGVIALMLAQKYNNAIIKAVEIQDIILEQAKDNISNSNYAAQIELIHGDIKNIVFNDTFDLIVCNPPYFKNHLAAQNQQKNIALHNDYLSFDDLYLKALDNLKDNGLFYVIYPYNEFIQFNKIAIHLYLHTEIEIYNKPNQLHRIIGVYSKNKDFIFTKRKMLLYNENNQRTDEFSALMNNYYL